MSILAGFPTGLLNLVDSQNFGINPKELSSMVVPTVEVGDLYLLSKQVGVVQIVAAPINGNNNGGGLIVPKGEVWRIHAGGLFVSTGGAASMDTLTPHVIVSGITIPIGETRTAGVPINTTGMIPMTANPFWLSAGGELGPYISNVAGVPTISIAYLVSKLRA